MKKILAVTMMTAAIGFSANAQAKVSIGAEGGWGFFSKSVPEATYNYGGKLDIMIGTKLSVGFIGGLQKTTDISILGHTDVITIMPLLGTLNYALGAMPGFYIGVNGGVMRTSNSLDGATATVTNGSTFGGQLGFDMALGTKVSLGAEGRYLYGSNGSLIQAVGQLKFWF